jgi:hypothetical protein
VELVEGREPCELLARLQAYDFTWYENGLEPEYLP